MSEMRYLWAPEHQFLYDNGAILAGGNVKVYRYETTILATLFDTNNQQVSNPVILDGNGRAIAIASTDYDYILEVRDIENNLIYTAIAYLHSGSGVVDIISSNHSIGITKSSSNVYDIQIKAGDYVYLDGNEINVRAKKIIADAPIYLNKVDNDFHIGIDGSSILSGISDGVNTTFREGVIDVTNADSTANKNSLALAFGHLNYSNGSFDTTFGNENSAYGSHGLIQGTRNVSLTSYNTVNGYENMIKGGFSNVNGSKVTVNDNSLFVNANGSNNWVSGLFNNVNGNDNIVTGEYLNIDGSMNSAFGCRYLNLNGYNNKVEKTDYTTVYGSSNEVTSAGDTLVVGYNNKITTGNNVVLLGDNLQAPSAEASYTFFAAGNGNIPRAGDIFEVSQNYRNILSVRNDGHVFLNNPISSNTYSGRVDLTKDYFSTFNSMFGDDQWAISTQHNHFRKTLYKAASNTDYENWINIIPTDSGDELSAGIPMYRTTDRGLYKLTINATVKGGYSISTRDPQIVTIQPMFSYTGCSNYIDMYQGFPKDTGSSANTPLNHYTMEWYLYNTGYDDTDDMIKMTSLQFYAANTRWNATQSTQSAIVNIDLVKIKDWNEVL